MDEWKEWRIPHDANLYRKRNVRVLQYTVRYSSCRYSQVCSMFNVSCSGGQAFVRVDPKRACRSRCFGEVWGKTCVPTQGMARARDKGKWVAGTGSE